MSSAALLLLLGTLLSCCVLVASEDQAANPIQKVLELLAKNEQDIIRQGEDSHKAYVEFSNMCQDRSTELQHEMKSAGAMVEDLKATIDKASDDEGELTTEVEELVSRVTEAEADLKKATEIRKKEAAAFKEDQKDLIDTIDQMERAISILEKNLKGASLAQLPVSVQKGTREVQKQRAKALTQAFTAIVDSSVLQSADTERLAALIQSSEGDTDSDSDEMDADEDSRGSKTDSGNIVDTLQSLLEKAQVQLETARSKESTASQNYKLFSASLKRKIEQTNKDMNNDKKAISECGQRRAKAQGDLETALKDLAEDKKALSELRHECMTKAADFSEATKGRAEELKALATAKKVIKEMTGGAEEQSYGDFSQISFVQARSQTSGAPASIKATNFIRALGKRQRLPVLLSMAKSMESVIRNSAVAGGDPFKKVKSMINSMIGRIEKQMNAEMDHKAYCDKEMSDTAKSKSDKEAAVEKLTTKVDTQSSTAMSLKEQVAVKQKEVRSIMKTQVDVDRIRKAEQALYKKARPELEQGLKGVKTALQVLRKYYGSGDEGGAALVQTEDADTDSATASASARGSGSAIIGLLEVIESDFAQGITSTDEEEATAQAAYVAQTQENEVSKATKQQEIVIKSKQAAKLESARSQSSGDLDGVRSELDAIMEYSSKIQAECVAKAEPFEERKKRHEAAMQGLQEALEVLRGPPESFLEQPASSSSARRLRGAAAAQQPTAGDADDS